MEKSEVDVLAWIDANRAWLFEGAAVAIPLAMLGYFFSRQQAQRKISVRQRQRGGDSSINTQVGSIIRSDEPDR